MPDTLRATPSTAPRVTEVAPRPILAPGAARARGRAHGLRADLEFDGVVLATPSSLHAAQRAAALDRAVLASPPVPRNVRRSP